MEMKDNSGLEWLRIMCAGLAATIGIVVLVGWHADIALLRQVHPNFVPMAYNTALGFVASALGLFFIHRKYIAIAIGLLVFFLGVVTLSQYIVDVQLGIDSLFFEHPIPMAANTAFYFSISGSCLIIAALQKRHQFFEIVFIALGFLVFLLGCIAFLGYLLSMPVAYGWGGLTEMAVHTAFGFMLVGLGLAAYGTHHFQENGAKLFSTIPLLTLIIGAIISIALWQYLALREEKDVFRTIRMTQEYLGDYVRDIIRKEEYILFEVAFDFSHEPGMNLNQKIVEKVQTGYPLVGGLGTVDPDGKVYWGLGLQNPEATKAVEKSVMTNGNAVDVSTLPIEVPGIGRGFTMVLPYYEDGVYQGSVFSVYDSQNLFGNLLSDSMLDNFGIAVYEDDILLYQNVEISDIAIQRNWVQLEKINTGRSNWELRTWPRSQLIKEIYSWAPNVVFMIALFLVTVLAAMVQLGINLRVSNKKVKKASKAKSDFLSSMSHELRTPLNAVIGYAQLLEYDKALNEDQKLTAGKIRSASKHLLSLINEILDLSKIEAGKLDISLEPISLDSVVKECYALSLPLAEKFDVTLNFERFHEDVTVKADFFRLKQIFLNLISNAIKYNKAGGSVSILVEPQMLDTVKIGICDTGLGMSQDQIAKLFEPFQRFAAEKSNIEGTGIGLTISKELVEKMHGKISVESKLGQGSVFWLELPIVESRPGLKEVLGDASQSVKEPNVSAAKSAYILVAEDNPANQEIIQQQLEYLGYKSKIVDDGEQAYEAWMQENFDAILMDCNMPGLDGYEASSKIRKDEKGQNMHIPIAAFTANAGKTEIQKCKDAGMDEILVKPVELEALQAALFKLTQQQQSSKKLLKGNSKPHKSDENIDFTVIEKYIGPNPAAQKKAFMKFVDLCPKECDEIRNAYEAKDDEGLRAHAHKLKSSARALGANKLADLCYELEQAGKAADWEKIEEVAPLIKAEIKAAQEEIIRHFK
jgi:signal transduction histidine kinase/CheY-like chemotaxis protein/HPt (histidine-containing phosphotransfer) domain-containing protein